MIGQIKKLSMLHLWFTKIPVQVRRVKKTQKQPVSWDLSNPLFLHLKYYSLLSVSHGMQSASLFLSPKAPPNLSFTKDLGGGEEV